jgi:hypothetical protein
MLMNESSKTNNPMRTTKAVRLQPANQDLAIFTALNASLRS